MRPILFIFLFIHAIASHAATSLYVQISDLHNRPLVGVIVSAKSGSSTSAPTDIAGKTKLTFTHDIVPGEPIELILVQAPSRLIIYSPWQGVGVIPNTTTALSMVLGAFADRAALENPKVLEAAATAALNSPPAIKRDPAASTQTPLAPSPLDAIQSMSTQAGLSSSALEDAIRRLGTQGSSAFELKGIHVTTKSAERFAAIVPDQHPIVWKVEPPMYDRDSALHQTSATSDLGDGDDKR